MGTTTTKSLQKTSSSPSDHSLSQPSSLWLLLLLGVLMAVVQATWRWPLGIPGHHGIEWMAFLLFGRLSASERCATLVVALSAAGSHIGIDQFVAQTHDLKTPALYLLTGAGVDLLYAACYRRVPVAVFGALAGGLAFTLKPLVTLGLVSLVNDKAGMFRHGIALPFVSHFVFGLVGGLGGALLYLSMHRKRTHGGT